MTPVKGTREWLKPALVKDRDNCPGAQVSMSSPHSHPQSLTLPWVFQSFPEPFHLITSFIPLFTALHTLTVFRAIVSSPVCLAGLRIKAFTHLFIHSMHQNTHQLAIEAGIFCVCWQEWDTQNRNRFSDLKGNLLNQNFPGKWCSLGRPSESHHLGSPERWLSFLVPLHLQGHVAWGGKSHLCSDL